MESKQVTATVRNSRKNPATPTQKVYWLKDQLPDAADQRDYARERCVVAITEAIGDAMERACVSRADVARRLDVNRSHITKLLSGEQNMTLHSLADLLWACDAEVLDVDLCELGVIEVAVNQTEPWQTDGVDNVSHILSA